MNSSPSVSIIVPLYNTEKYIYETIESVINQTYKKWRLIIIDDGSTDNSKSIAQSFCEKDTRVEYYYQNNSGVSSARNNGINKSKEEDYIFFLDADDVWKKTNIEERLLYFENNQNVDWIFGSVELIDEESKSKRTFLTGSDDDILSSLLSWNGEVITNPSTLTLKQKCLTNLQFDTQISTAADQDFLFYLANKYKGQYFKAPLVLYRILSDSMSRNISKMEKDHIAVYKKAKANKLFPSYAFQKKCFSKLYLILAGSWWKNGNNKTKGFYYLLLSLATFPPVFISLLKKLNKN